MRTIRSTSLVLAAVLLLSGCGEETTPNRNQIPYLKSALFDLQGAVQSKNAAQIDSLLSGSLEQLGADSLLNYVYGSETGFAFVQFGGNVIAYTDDNARIDCFIMDSVRSEDRPISFSLEYDGGRWLFTRIESGQGIKITDSLDESTD